VGTIETVKVVLDTNVLISALLFGGVPGQLRPLWRRKLIQPFVSREIIQEYLQVLAYPKFQLTESEIEYLLHKEILPWFETIRIPEGKPFVLADPSDDKFIWCAQAASASWIISGDDHLLTIEYPNIAIIRPARFLEIFGKHS
jgi:uncharacterized protein